MLAARNLVRRKVRSLLTVLGIAFGVATVVALIAVAGGLRGQFNAFFDAGNAHLVVSRKGAADPFLSFLPESLLDELRGEEGVAAAHPVVLSAKQVPGMPLLMLFGTTAGSPLLADMVVSEGRGLFDEVEPERRVCLGRRGAQSLALDVGSTIDFDGEEYEVVGIFESGIPFLDAACLLTFHDAQRIAGLDDKMISAMLHLDPFEPERLGETEAALEERFPDIEVSAPSQFANAFDEFDLLDDAILVFTLLAILIGGIGVMNTMLMSVFERTREIGILQAIGWSKRMILRQILTEAALVCAVGGPLGILMGVTGIEVVSSIGELAWVAGEYGPRVFVQALVVAFGMGLFGASYPTWRALRVTPIEALRYE